ncbi:MAG: YggS family pyridoxal phosphate-dependent enzyme [Rickettsiales bacterium]
MSTTLTLANIRENIEKSLQKSPFATQKVAILGASKGQSVAIIENTINRGIALFGENKVQEASEKWIDLKKQHSDVKLHLIGPLQTNKVKQALSLFDAIQTVDRPKLAEAIAKELARINEMSAAARTSHEPGSMAFSEENAGNKTFFIQVNTGEEPQKSGIIPSEADDFIDYCKNELKLPIVGLMCVPPADQPPAPHFALLKTIADRHGLQELSMGMSSDYETAARMGSTCVRIGTALFGTREN